MIISEKQLQMMYIVLTDSIKADHPIFGLTYETRQRLWEVITNQQRNELIDVDK